MKTVDIEWITPHTRPAAKAIRYTHTTKPTFTILNKQARRGVYRQYSMRGKCREQLISKLVPKRLVYHSLGGSTKTETLSTAKLRIMVDFATSSKVFEKKAEAWMETAVKILNVLEKSQGWSLTKLRKVDNEYLKDNDYVAYAFFGSAKWMRSAPLMSMYLLCIRLGKDPSVWEDFKSLDDLQKVWQTICSRERCSIVERDRGFFHRSYKSWPVILNNHKQLFFFRSLRENFKANGGIIGLEFLRCCHINKHIVDKHLRDRWRAVMKKEKANAKGSG